jgi:hypothetical protein
MLPSFGHPELSSLTAAAATFSLFPLHVKSESWEMLMLRMEHQVSEFVSAGKLSNRMM